MGVVLRILLACIILITAAPVYASGQADHIMVYKSKRKMQLMRDGEIIRQYQIALGDNPVGHKLYEGDERTPVGHYYIKWRNPESRFHLSLNISYPDVADRAVARSMGFRPGGDIMIHGLPNGKQAHDVNHPYTDWTNGCIAVTNEEMEEIWHMVGDGTPITIRP